MNHPRILASARSVSDVLVESVRHETKPLANLRRLSGKPVGDEDEFELPLVDDVEPAVAPEAQNFVRPDDVAVAALLGRALDEHRDLLRNLLSRDAVTVIEVPGVEYIEPVGRILRRHVVCDGRVLDGDSLQVSDTTIAAPETLVVFTRDGANKAKLSAAGNEEFASAVQRRCAVVGIAADPERALPRDLVRLAKRIVVPPLDSDAIATVVEAITGRRPPSVDPDLAHRTRLNALLASVRADLGPDRSLERLGLLRDGGGESAPRLSELHGLGAAKEWALGLVRDLQDFAAGRIPWNAMGCHGACLTGPPGVGKTALAAAIAREAGCTFIPTSYAQWQSHREGHLGHVTQAILTTFLDAQKNAPSVLMIDEVDSLPARAGNGRNGGKNHDSAWWDAVTNTLLTCLAGVERREGVVVLATCNTDPSRLDPALLRAGRLGDHVIKIPLPDVPGLCGIIRTHLRGDLEGVDVLPAAVAARRANASGADIERWCRVGRRSGRLAQRPMTLDDLLAAIRDGAIDLPPDIRRRVAVHEAGHAVATIALGMPTPRSVSIDTNGGFTEAGLQEPAAQTRAYFERYLICGLSGRAAEELVYGATDITAGAGGGGERSDLSVVTALALRMEANFGLGELGPISVDTTERDLLYFPDLRQSVTHTIRKAYAASKDLLTHNRRALDALAHSLFVSGYLDHVEIEAVMAQTLPSRPATEPTATPTLCLAPPVEPDSPEDVADVPTGPADVDAGEQVENHD